MADHELDHLILISLGGAPPDAKDLWLQCRQGQANAADKNALAYVLWRLVCEPGLSFGTEQEAIPRLMRPTPCRRTCDLSLPAQGEQID
jgi:hypothetical protein